MSVPGYEVPIHRSLTEQIMIAGVPRKVAILNGTFVAAMGLGLHSFLAIPLGFVLHILAYAASKRDPQFFDVFSRHTRQKNYYSA